MLRLLGPQTCQGGATLLPCVRDGGLIRLFQLASLWGASDGTAAAKCGGRICEPATPTTLRRDRWGPSGIIGGGLQANIYG